jgi:hypothetical protein
MHVPTTAPPLPHSPHRWTGAATPLPPASVPLGFDGSSAIEIAGAVAGTGDVAGAGAVAGATPRVALSTASPWVQPGAVSGAPPAHVAEARRASEAAMATLADEGAAHATAPASAPATAPAADGEGAQVPTLGHAAGGAVLSLRAAGRLGDRPSTAGRARAVVGAIGGDWGVPNLVSGDPLADCRELFVPSRCHTAAQQTVLRRAAAVLHAANRQRVAASVVALCSHLPGRHLRTTTKSGSELKSFREETPAAARGVAAASAEEEEEEEEEEEDDNDDDDDDEDDEDDEDDDEEEEDEEEDDEEDKKRARIRSHTGADSASSAAATTAAIAFAPPSWDIRWRTSAALSAATEASDRMPEGRCDLFKGGWRTNGLGAEMARLL